MDTRTSQLLVQFVHSRLDADPTFKFEMDEISITSIGALIKYHSTGWKHGPQDGFMPYDYIEMFDNEGRQVGGQIMIPRTKE